MRGLKKPALDPQLQRGGYGSSSSSFSKARQDGAPVTSGLGARGLTARPHSGSSPRPQHNLGRGVTCSFSRRDTTAQTEGVGGPPPLPPPHRVGCLGGLDQGSGMEPPLQVTPPPHIPTHPHPIPCPVPLLLQALGHPQDPFIFICITDPIRCPHPPRAVATGLSVCCAHMCFH